MEISIFPLLFTIVIAIIFIIVAFFIPTEPDIIKQQDDIPNFSANITYDPFPSEINLENPNVCSVDTLQKCTLSDPLSCFGCQELIATCQHFNADTKYINGEGIETIIPKNETANDGYCLSVRSAVESCNPWHGDLVLVALDPKSTSYGLLCSCKHPGYIGNTSYLGACNSVFVCNGEIDNINKPLEEIECVCNNPLQINERYDTVPVCKDASILEMNNISDNFTNLIHTTEQFIPIEHFNKDIAQNINVTQLPNPCLYCPITGQRIEGGVLATLVDSEGATTSFCTTKTLNDTETTVGIPYRQNEDSRILRGDAGPDCVLGLVPQKYNIVQNILRPHNIFATITKASNPEFFAMLRMTEDSTVIRLPVDTLYGHHIRAGLRTQQQSTGRCWGHWPGYSCELKFTGESRLWSVRNPEYSYYAGAARDPPDSFLWSKDTWIAWKSVMSNITDRANGVFLNNNLFKEDLPKGGSVMIEVVPNVSRRIVTSTNYDDYKIHKSELIDI